MSSIGTTVLWPGEGDVLVDIWFVHGLRGDALKTWTTKDNVCWPRDLLNQDVKQARTITWGYDADILNFVKPAGQASIFAHAENLLTAVMRSRLLGNDKERSRPIIFVGHSLGGLVIKQALIRAAEYYHNDEDPDKGAIYSLCKGVVFLGTPHRGSKTADLGSLAANIAKAVLQRPNKGLLETLKQGSHILESKRKSFASVSGDISIVCIYEELEVRGAGLVVPEYSASIDGKGIKTGSIHANHMDMCKFSDTGDPGYQITSTHILVLMRAITEGPRLTSAQSASLGRIITWLSPPDVEDFHYQACQKHVRYTGDWLLKDPQGSYYRWKTSQSKARETRLLWLSGKAGCGKTILCSSIIEVVRQHCKSGLAHIAFFYFSFSDSMRQSYTNLLRSLIVQLIEGKPPSSAIAAIHAANCHKSPVPFLENMLCEVLSQHQTSQVFLILDALDECPGDSALEGRGEVLTWIQDLLAGAHGALLHVLVTSRSESDIEEVMQAPFAVRAAIDTSDVNGDILRYIESEIVGHTKLRKLENNVKATVKERLSKKADGMFRWAYCQLEEPKNLQFTGSKYIMKALDELPPTLDDTYDRMLQRIRYIPEARAALQWLVASVRPLTLYELSEACCIDPEAEPYFDVEKRCPFGEIVDVLSGLVVVHLEHDQPPRRYRIEPEGNGTASGKSIIRFAHFSVKEYLLSTRIMSKSTSVFGINEEASKGFIAESCVAYLLHWRPSLDPSLDLSLNPSLNPSLGPHALPWTLPWTFHWTLPSVLDPPLDPSPLSNYASTYWFKHSRINNRPQNIKHQIEFLSCEHGLPWGVYSIDEQTLAQSATETYPLCNSRAYAIIYSTPKDQGFDYFKDVVVPGMRPSWNAQEKAFHVSVHLELFTVVKQLVEVLDVARSSAVFAESGPSNAPPWLLNLLLCKGMDPNITTNTNAKLMSLLARECAGKCTTNVEALIRAGADVNAYVDTTVLQTAAYNGSEKIVEMLITAGAKVNAKSGFYGYALQAAAYAGRGGIVKSLIKTGADVNAEGGYYNTALQAASSCGIRGLIEDLIKAGASIDAQGGYYGTALQACAYAGTNQEFEVLMNAGADVNIQGGYFGNALQAAVATGKDQIFKTLLSAVADVNATGGYCGTALQAAAARGFKDYIQALVDAGADVNARGGAYGTALQAAARRGSQVILQALINAGADVNAEGGRYGTALHAAWCHEYRTCDEKTLPKTLITAGANITTCTLRADHWDWTVTERKPCDRCTCIGGKLAAFFERTTAELKGVIPSTKRKVLEADIETSDGSEYESGRRAKMRKLDSSTDEIEEEDNAAWRTDENERADANRLMTMIESFATLALS